MSRERAVAVSESSDVVLEVIGARLRDVSLAACSAPAFALHFEAAPPARAVFAPAGPRLARAAAQRRTPGGDAGGGCV
jgi:hypothetical protein